MKKHKLVLIILLALAATEVHAQWEPAKLPKGLLEDIEEDVWKPFMESYRDYDAEKIKSIHTSDIIRINVDRNTIEQGEPYLTSFGSSVKGWQDQNRIVRISFSILSTAFNDDLVNQRGYYCFSSKNQDEDKITPKGYSFFNVLLRKEDGKWKIAVDSDTRSDIGEAEFRSTRNVYEFEN